ncbi:hypothetical protein FOL47_007494 [Perkinsus chesapeaki]|uniref:Thioredoxin domain-containing protein n=1 Tax=Perkinsus chesapeaki TaxID=330153 RepID=A0A7J6LK23_PERCH|nr:hypothetical protein FOL47_007494 [Perkinsus chesapeaki]
MSASLLAGKTLLKQDGSAVSADDVMLKKDIIALYFAAHWCPDCTAFTPTLNKFYEDVKAKDPNKLEIVFVSSDKSENEQVAYHQNDMADWLRVPFNDKRTRAMLKKEYGVCAKKEMDDLGMSDSQRKSGIPTLVVLSKNRRTVKVFDAGTDIEKYGDAAVERPTGDKTVARDGDSRVGAPATTPVNIETDPLDCGEHGAWSAVALACICGEGWITDEADEFPCSSKVGESKLSSSKKESGGGGVALAIILVILVICAGAVIAWRYFRLRGMPYSWAFWKLPRFSSHSRSMSFAPGRF